jgi:MFS family permease
VLTANSRTRDADFGDATGVLSPARRALSIGLLLVLTLVAFEALAVATVLPAAEQDIGGLRLYGWAFGAFLLASLIGITWAGRQADRRGPARPFAVGLVFFGVGLTIGGAAPSMLVLVVARAIQGLGAGSVPAVAYTVIGRAYPERLRPRMFALLSTAWVVPGLIGPAIAGAVAEYATWRLVFLGLLPILAAVAAMTLSPLARLGPPDDPSTSGDRTGRALQLAVGAAVALAGLSMEHVPGLALVAAGVAVALPAFRRLVPPGTLRAAGPLPAAIAAHGLLNAAFFGADAFVPLMLTSRRGQSTVMAGVVLTTATLSWTAGSWLQERLAHRVDRRTTARAGMALVVVGVGAMAVVVSPAVPVAAAAVSWGIAGFGIGMAYQSFSLIVLSLAAPGREGEAAAAMKISETIGAALGAGVGGALIAFHATDGPRALAVAATFGVMAAVGLLGCAAALRLAPGGRIGDPARAEAAG